ncbi:MAG TPA: M15 family metallopeptidase [Gammaproteobacteria bacterium]|nr:M15 family metallopeptidase [Gammaproteobacteria bacterium]
MKKSSLLWAAIVLSVSSSLTYADDGFRGSVSPIPSEISKNMIGHTWHAGCPLPLDRMSYLTVTYWGFDHKPHDGHLIVLDLFAGEVLQIFHDLYQIKFPIEKMVLPDKYASQKNDWSSIDWKSSEDNNTSAFLCREDDQTQGQFSPHSWGIALDINPVYNPSRVAGNKVEPASGKKYFNRSLNHEGMIDEKVVAIFAKHGWKWGGYWAKDKTDYQHFQKDMDEHYMCPVLLPVIKNGD